MSRTSVRGALWQAMVGRAESLNQAVVMGQREAHTRSAKRIQRFAEEIAMLAKTIVLISDERGKS